ncbi:hypothetical protein RKD19_005618 [Streptomyces canus]
MTTEPGVSAAANASSPARSSSRPSARTTARSSSAARETSSECARPPRSADPSRTHSASRAACPASASGLFAERAYGSTPAGSGTSSDSGWSGACSMTTCALVPLTPKEETAARRGRSSSGQVRASVSSSTAPDSQSTLLDGRSTCSVLGSTPCRIASTTLMMLAAPAAPWVCPMLDFNEPSHKGCSAGRSLP